MSSRNDNRFLEWADRFEQALSKYQDWRPIQPLFKELDLQRNILEPEWSRLYTVFTKAMEHVNSTVAYIAEDKILESISGAAFSLSWPPEKARALLQPLLANKETWDTNRLHQFIWEAIPLTIGPWRVAINGWIDELAESKRLAKGYFRDDFERARDLLTQAETARRRLSRDSSDEVCALLQRAETYLTEISPLIRGVGGYFYGVVSLFVEEPGKCLEKVVQQERASPGVLGPFLRGCEADLDYSPPCKISRSEWEALLSTLPKDGSEPVHPALPSLMTYLDEDA